MSFSQRRATAEQLLPATLTVAERALWAVGLALYGVADVALTAVASTRPRFIETNDLAATALDVERTLQQYQTAENIAPRDPFINLSERGVRTAVKRTAEAAAEGTSDPDSKHVSSHDLRRRFAEHLLVDEDINPRVVMQVGGWDSFQAIEPYLNAPMPDVVDSAFAEASLS